MFHLRSRRLSGADAQDQLQPSESLLTSGGLSVEQVARLKRLRERIESGELNETMVDPRRLLFARWLFIHGYLSDWN